MGRKGVSLQEKRERILHIYHESKEVFNLKEIEKLGAKAGVGTPAQDVLVSFVLAAKRIELNHLYVCKKVLQTVKDVNQALVDDTLVDCDKVCYVW